MLRRRFFVDNRIVALSICLIWLSGFCFLGCGGGDSGLTDPSPNPGTDSDADDDWKTLNASINNDGTIQIDSIRNQTEYAYQEVDWDGNSDITFSLEVMALSKLAYADYIKLGIMPEGYTVDGGRYNAEKYCYFQFGYSDNSSDVAGAYAEGYDEQGFAPTQNQWYRYQIQYDASEKLLMLTVFNSDSTVFWSNQYVDFQFNFNTTNRLFGVFSLAGDADYGNPKQSIAIRNFTLSIRDSDSDSNDINGKWTLS